MKKRITCFTLSFLCLFLLYSCGVIKVHKTNEPKILELSYPQVDGYRLFSVGLINDNSLVVVLESNEINDVKKIYRVNLSEVENKLIYEGEVWGSMKTVYVKNHPNDTYSIQFENKSIFIFDTATDNLIRTIDLDQVKGSYFNISNSGEKLLYATAKGLYVSNLNFQSETAIYSPEDLTSGARWPSFSNDDGKVAFAIGEPVSMQKCVLDIATGETITINYNSYYTFWPKNLDGFITYDNAFVRDTPDDIQASIKYFDFGGKEINTVNINTVIYSIGITQDYVAYYYDVQTIQQLTETGFRDCKIMLWNFKSGELQELDVEYQIQEIWSYQASSEGNRFLMFMTVVNEGKAVPKVLWIDLD